MTDTARMGVSSGIPQGKVLLVLESAALGRKLAGLVAETGIRAEVARSAAEALRVWDERVVVVLIDAGLAADAAVLIERAKIVDARVLVAGTGLQGMDVLNLIESGARGYVPLPQPAELIARVVTEHFSREHAARLNLKQVVSAKSELEAVFDTFPSPLFVLGPDAKIRRANKATLGLSGERSYMDIVGRQCFDVLGCGVSDRCPILMGLRGEASDPMHLSMSVEWTHPILGRRYRPRYFSTVPTADEEGTLGNGMLIMVEDVTAVHQFESDSSREQKLNAVGLLAATLSHEINQPLGAIMGRAQLAIISLEREHLDVPALKRDLEEIVESVNRVSKILDKLHQVTDIVTKPYLGETEILDLERSSRTERGED